jgi:hypothetical protein
MASTYQVANSITYTQAICVGIPVSAIQIAAADQINSIMWNAYPWRWAQKTMTGIALVDGTQDYTYAPADYMRQITARLVRTDTTPDIHDELTVVRNLVPDLTKAGFRSGLTQISYNAALTKLRLNQAAAVPSGSTFEIQGEYQFQPTKITGTSATFPFPDQYFKVFNDGLLWQFYMLSKDDRAGTVQFTKNGAVYTGQLGVFFDGLMAMREAEDWGAGDNIFPSDPIGVIGAGSPFANTYGF